MPEYNSNIQPVSNFYLLDDSYLKGGIHTVDTKSDLDAIPMYSIKLGMWVAVNDESGKIYECTTYSSEEDEFGDTVVTSEFTPIEVPAITRRTSIYNRPTKHINFSYISPGLEGEQVIDMGCKSFVLASLVVTEYRKMNISIYGSLLKDDPMPYSLNTSRKNFDDGSTYLLNRSRFQYRKFNIISNLNTGINSTFFVFTCKSLETNTYFIDRNYYTEEVYLDLSYIPLEPQDT